MGYSLHTPLQSWGLHDQTTKQFLLVSRNVMIVYCGSRNAMITCVCFVCLREQCCSGKHVCFNKLPSLREGGVGSHK